MHLSQKTKDLMEFIFMTGFDAFANAPRLHSSLNYYGGWEHPSSYLRQMRAIQEKGLLGGNEPRKSDWIPELTADGIETIAEQVAPERFWNQSWDGAWRTVTFDIPATDHKERQRLNLWLKRKRFGHLQGSLWLSARPYSEWSEQIAQMNLDPKAVIFIEGKPLGSLSDETIVTRSWPFEAINARYQTYLNYLRSAPPTEAADDVSSAFADWFRRETRLWREATDSDPLLPRALHPAGYLGEKAWAARKQAFANWKTILAS